MRTRNLVIAAAVLVAVVVVSGYFVNERWRVWNERAEQVVVFAKAETARADKAEAASATQRARGDSIAREAAARAPEIRERIVRVREESEPDAPRDSIIDDLVVEAYQWKQAWQEADSAYFVLAFAYSTLRVANDSLITVLEARPKPRPRWAPTLSVGVFAGVCSDGQFCAGIGPGITFEVKLPTPF